MHTVAVCKACAMSDNITNGAGKLNVCVSCLIVHDSQPWTVSDEVCIINVAPQNSVCDSCRVRQCYGGPTFRNPVRHSYGDYLIFLIVNRLWWVTHRKRSTTEYRLRWQCEHKWEEYCICILAPYPRRFLGRVGRTPLSPSLTRQRFQIPSWKGVKNCLYSTDTHQWLYRHHI